MSEAFAYNDRGGGGGEYLNTQEKLHVGNGGVLEFTTSSVERNTQERAMVD